jgi:hypothetical protein
MTDITNPTRDFQTTTPAQAFMIVEKTSRGYRAACAVSFATVAEADAWRRANLPTLDTRISRRLPSSVGHGFFNLNDADLVA